MGDFEFEPWEIKAIAKERALRNKFDPSFILRDAFPQQLSFINDSSKLKAVFCTRRSAKSFTLCLALIYDALKTAGGNYLFLGLTRESAKNIAWKDILKVLNHRYNLGARFNQTELSMTLPNGSVVRVTGVDADQDEMNKLLGGKYRVVAIDEASMYTIDVRNLVYGVLKPAMTDPNASGERGTICLGGTSSNFTRGLFFDVTTGKEPGWSLHTWTAHDNPYVAKQWQEELDEIEEKRPLYKETPQFKQWYLNKWCIDEEKLVYKFSHERNTIKELEKFHNQDGWTFILGSDVGWEDDNALVLVGYHINDRNKYLYVIRTFKKAALTFDDLADRILIFMQDEQYPPCKVIIDGANKQGVESMRARSNIPFEYADKLGKVDFIELLNSDLIQGKIKFLPGTEDLQNEMMSLVWQTEGDKIKYPKKENPSIPNHLCDAFLYAWRNGYHYQSQAEERKVTKYSKEWYEQQSREIWEREREIIEKENNKSDWQIDNGD